MSPENPENPEKLENPPTVQSNEYYLRDLDA